MFEGMSERNTNAHRVKKEKKKELLVPKQHPKNLHDPDTSILPRGPVSKNLTPLFRVPDEAFIEVPFKKFQTPQGARGLDVAIIGGPNVGKSAIFNNLIDRQLAAVSPKAGTTYEKEHGIVTDLENNLQFNFYDTPGAAHMRKFKKDRNLQTKEWEILNDVDLAMFVADSVRKLDNDTRNAL